MSWFSNLADPTVASKSLTGMLKNLEAKLDAVLEIPQNPGDASSVFSNVFQPLPKEQDEIKETNNAKNNDKDDDEKHVKNDANYEKADENTPKIDENTPKITENGTDITENINENVTKEKETQEEHDSTNLEAQIQKLKEIIRNEGNKMASLKRELDGKNQMIQDLKNEGDKLSKDEGKAREAMKRLRSKDLENNRTISELNRKIETCVNEISELKDTKGKLLDLERKQTESIRGLNSYNQELSKKLKSVQSEAEQLSEKNEELGKELEKIILERSEEQSGYSADEYQKLKKEYEEFKSDALNRDFDLKKELFDLRNLLASKEKEHGWKEDHYQKEIANLNLRLQKSESRHEDLSVIGQEATKPLLRQIESLQIQYNTSLKNWESLEKSMNNRVKDAELGRSESIERERILKEENQQLIIKIKNIESQLLHTRNEKTILNVELEDCKRSLETEREKLYNLSASFELAKEKHDNQIQQIKTSFEEKYKRELEKERRIWFEDKEAEIARIKLNNSVELSRRNSISQVSTDNVTKENRQVEFNKTNMIMIEKLQLSLKQSEAIVTSLQTQISLITKTRDDLASELYKLSTENEDLKKSNQELKSIQSEKESVESKLMACVELLGGKEEMINELKADIEEMRQVYKSQVEELIGKINSHK